MNSAPQPPKSNEVVWKVNTTNFEKKIKVGNKNTPAEEVNISWANRPLKKRNLPPLPPSPKANNGKARKSRKARKTRRQRK